MQAEAGGQLVHELLMNSFQRLKLAQARGARIRGARRYSWLNYTGFTEHWVETDSYWPRSSAQHLVHPKD